MRLSYYLANAEKLPRTFCGIAEKSYYAGERVSVITKDEEFAKGLDSVLWTYSKKHFIPHALASDPYPEKQPILINWQAEESSESANIIFTVNIKNDMVLQVLSSIKGKDQNLTRLIFLEDEQVAKENNHKIENIISQSEFCRQDLEKFQQQPNGSWLKL